jgi:threonine/homoserine/homoserine lactone efflux protein
MDAVLGFPLPVLLAFLTAGIMLNLTPGTDVVFATASGLSGGPRVGALAGVGVGLGGLWHVGLAAAGVSALLAAHPGAFAVLRYAGAGYLLWLAVRAWRVGDAQGAPVRGADRPAQALWRGFVTNALNPKVALFVLAFLPQFTDPARGPVWAQILTLGALFALTGMAITAGYGMLAGRFSAVLTRRARLLNRVSSVMFGALAARILWD